MEVERAYGEYTGDVLDAAAALKERKPHLGDGRCVRVAATNAAISADLHAPSMCTAALAEFEERGETLSDEMIR